MRAYLDASVLVALFLPDPQTVKATAAVAKLSDAAVVSDIAALEFASTVARKVRAGELAAKDGKIILSNFDIWTDASARLSTESADVVAADAIVRQFDVNLHGADAIHVAMTMRIGATLLTLDAKMKANAKKLGVPVT